tara:strand:+ start:190 stop:717 length:528 start_codon:yes stop_codon:yes gene_type:complete
MQLLEEIENFDIHGVKLREITNKSDSSVSRLMIGAGIYLIRTIPELVGKSREEREEIIVGCRDILNRASEGSCNMYHKTAAGFVFRKLKSMVLKRYAIWGIPVILLHLQKNGMIPAVLEFTTPGFHRGYFGAHLTFLKSTGYYRAIRNVQEMADKLSADGDNDGVLLGRLSALSI